MKIQSAALLLVSGFICFQLQAAEPQDDEPRPVRVLVSGYNPLQFKISEQMHLIGNSYDPVVWQGHVPTGQEGVFVDLPVSTHPLRISVRSGGLYLGTAHINTNEASTLESIQCRHLGGVFAGASEYYALHLIFSDGTELYKTLKR